MDKTENNTLLSKDIVMDLLFKDDQNITPVRNDCFDMFGNYSYPTDMMIDTPNIAVGSSDGFQFLNLIDLKKQS